MTIELEIGRRQLQPESFRITADFWNCKWKKAVAVCDAWSATTTDLEQLELPVEISKIPMKIKKGRKTSVGSKKGETGSQNSSTDSVNSGSGSDYQICKPLGWEPWWG